ncbi:MAG: RnfABCDGE type electron transport complex subunit D [Chitinispirillaceae bacterium]|nr:RnfABCDGE type electron transport complex subunit D [Chitinispirillaceae bacterium]
MKQTATLHPVIGPYIHANIYTPHIMWEVSAALAPALLAAWFFFGLNALVIVCWCTGFCVLFEAAYDHAIKKQIRIGDGSAFLAGLLLAFNLPPFTPWYVCAVGSFVAMVIVKSLFGGLGQNLFNPALAGRAFCMAVFPVTLATYTAPVRSFVSFDAITTATPLAVVKNQGIDALVVQFSDTSHLISQLVLGDRGGCTGETSIIALLIGGVYLIGRLPYALAYRPVSRRFCRIGNTMNDESEYLHHAHAWSRANVPEACSISARPCQVTMKYC